MADASDVQADLMTRYLGLMPATGEDQVLRLIVETGVRAVGADEGSLLVYDPEANDLTFVMTYGNKESESILIGQRVPFGKGLAGLAAETGEVQIGAPRYDPPCAGFVAACAGRDEKLVVGNLRRIGPRLQ